MVVLVVVVIKVEVVAVAALVVNHSWSHTGTFIGTQSSSKLIPLTQHKPTHYQC